MRNGPFQDRHQDRKPLTKGDHAIEGVLKASVELVLVRGTGDIVDRDLGLDPLEVNDGQQVVEGLIPEIRENPPLNHETADQVRIIDTVDARGQM